MRGSHRNGRDDAQRDADRHVDQDQGQQAQYHQDAGHFFSASSSSRSSASTMPLPRACLSTSGRLNNCAMMNSTAPIGMTDWVRLVGMLRIVTMVSPSRITST